MAITSSAPIRSVEKQRVERRLGRHHLAFYRAHIERLPLEQIAWQYLDTRSVRYAQVVLKWIRDELDAAARRKSPSMSRLVRIHPDRLAATPALPVPSLEEFRDVRDPDGFYQEEELLQLLYEEYGSQINPRDAKKASRNERLRKRLIAAVHSLEPYVSGDPSGSDLLARWLAPVLTARLTEVRICTVADLLALMRSGKSWASRVPRLGPRSVERLQHWVEMNAQSLADIMPAQAEGFWLSPLDQATSVDALSGRQGANRAFGAILPASNDYEAILAWLKSIGDSHPHTVRAYRIQADRFLAWALFEKGKPLSSLTTVDCADYRDFLSALDPMKGWRWTLPREKWVGPRTSRRWTPGWKPFSGPLSVRSQRTAVTIISSLANWLVSQLYLRANPWLGVSSIAAPVATIKADHHFTRGQWKAILDTLEELPRGEPYYRLRFALLFAYGTGLRLSELADARMQHTRIAQDEIEVLGKGSKLRRVPFPKVLQQALFEYLVMRGYPNVAEVPDTEPLIATLGGELLWNKALARMPISTSALYNLLRHHFRAAAKRVEEADPDSARRLRMASPHWLRHTHGSHAVAAGARLNIVMEMLGHASLATTSIYVTAETDEKLAVANSLLGAA